MTRLCAEATEYSSCVGAHPMGNLQHQRYVSQGGAAVATADDGAARDDIVDRVLYCSEASILFSCLRYR